MCTSISGSSCFTFVFFADWICTSISGSSCFTFVFFADWVRGCGFDEEAVAVAVVVVVFSIEFGSCVLNT